jgi:hypothetical protein
MKRNVELLEAFMSTAVADLPDTVNTLPETMECPLCLGKGELTRAEVLERVGKSYVRGRVHVNGVENFRRCISSCETDNRSPTSLSNRRYSAECFIYVHDNPTLQTRNHLSSLRVGRFHAAVLSSLPGIGLSRRP